MNYCKNQIRSESHLKTLKKVLAEPGLEPGSPQSPVRCFNQLSYSAPLFKSSNIQRQSLHYQILTVAFLSPVVWFDVFATLCLNSKQPVAQFLVRRLLTSVARPSADNLPLCRGVSYTILKMGNDDAVSLIDKYLCHFAGSTIVNLHRITGEDSDVKNNILDTLSPNPSYSW